MSTSARRFTLKHLFLAVTLVAILFGAVVSAMKQARTLSMFAKAISRDGRTVAAFSPYLNRNWDE